MNVIGVGTDIVECQRIEEMIAKHDRIFLERVFTKAEIEYCTSRKPNSQHFAGRWAAKEAILKAIGTGWARGILWTEMEVLNEAGGQPRVCLFGTAARIAGERGIRDILISISHTKQLATAFATAVGQSPKAD